MKFKLEKLSNLVNAMNATDEQGKSIRLDLWTDSSFPEITDALNKLTTVAEQNEYLNSLNGRTIECESILPYTPCYFVCNGKLI